MKKLVVLIIIIAALAGWYIWHGKIATPTEEIKVMPTVTHPDPSNATFIVEDEPITLKNGKAVSELAPGSLSTEETSLTSDLAYGDINKDGNNDTVALLLQSGGGSGTFVYLVAYVSGNVGYKGSNAVFIGDRISPKSVAVSSAGVITLKYLDRKPSEAMASEPTVPVTKTFDYKAGKLEER